MEVGKIIIVVRCSPPTYPTTIKMGTKTILTLRDSTLSRSPHAISETRSPEHYDEGRNKKTRWKGTLFSFQKMYI